MANECTHPSVRRYEVVGLDNYGIDELVRAGKKGWQELEKFASGVTGEKTFNAAISNHFGFVSVAIAEFLRIAPVDTWHTDDYQYGRLRDAEADFIIKSAAARLKPGKTEKELSSIWRSMLEEQIRRKRPGITPKLVIVLTSAVRAFIENSTYRGAFEQLVCSDQRKDYFNLFFVGMSQADIDKWLAQPITACTQGIARQLLEVLDDPSAIRKALWNITWLNIQPDVEEFLQIKELILADKPVSNRQIVKLNEIVKHGAPRGCWIPPHDGSRVFKVVMQFTGDDVAAPTAGDLLLIQPAFLLLQDIQAACLKPRFIRKCRAPGCQVSFYTADHRQIYCSRPEPVGISPCKTRGDAYRKYLLKQNLNPEKHWDDSGRQECFLSQYSPRGAQSRR